MSIYTCENSLEGVFSAIFQAYADRHPHNDNKIIAGTVHNYELFARYIPVPVDKEHAFRVSKTLQKQLGTAVYYDLCTALNCASFTDTPCADAVYHTVVLGLSMKQQGPHVLEQLTNPHVQTVFQCARNVRNEVGHLLGFLRFRELQNGILYASVHPANQVLVHLTKHFDNRMPLESYIIYDQNRDIAALHQPQQPSIFMSHPNFNQQSLSRYSEQEQQFEELWVAFFHSICIETRKNAKLQQQNIPKRFWQDTIELS